jgi:cell wall-associated NlpC family hydrolase
LPDLSGLIGIPFLDQGRDPAVGLDCWGMFMEVQRRFGNHVPDFRIPCKATPQIGEIVSSELGKWERIEEPEAGCAVLMAISPEMPDVVQHFGVYIGNGKFLHTLEKTGAIVSRVGDAFWSKKIRGFYRWIR